MERRYGSGEQENKDRDPRGDVRGVCARACCGAAALARRRQRPRTERRASAAHQRIYERERGVSERRRACVRLDRDPQYIRQAVQYFRLPSFGRRDAGKIRFPGRDGDPGGRVHRRLLRPGSDRRAVCAVFPPPSRRGNAPFDEQRQHGAGQGRNAPLPEGNVRRARL